MIIVLLLALFNDISMRKLGGARWKALQRWNYVAVRITFVHALLYQLTVEGRPPPWIALAGVIVVCAVAIQVIGFGRGGPAPGKRDVGARQHLAVEPGKLARIAPGYDP